MDTLKLPNGSTIKLSKPRIKLDKYFNKPQSEQKNTSGQRRLKRQQEFEGMTIQLLMTDDDYEQD